jgi:hypothetical protein
MTCNVFVECNDAADMGVMICFEAWIIFVRQSKKGIIAPSAVSVFSQNQGM